MSKVTIKFWDEEREEYFDRSSLGYGRKFTIDENMNVEVVSSRHQVGTDLIPHFYKDGKRIA